MWAQRLRHKNTSRVKPPKRNDSVSLVALFLISLSSRLVTVGNPPVACALDFVMRKKRWKKSVEIFHVYPQVCLFFNLYGQL